ncbi:hypothetical protein PIB30_098439 [Stylosanthes scabra]|uniref:Uncharacterized protein n=1 Tax=Stylosanthes scabra TaxID=79078 RepID=A0ABU6XU64_9FABA|nr:hypothetical protein [Stylosanthes scabra]
MAEVFKQTHTLKVNKEQFADKRSSDIWDDFTSNTMVATQQAAESGTNAEASSVSLTSPAPVGLEDAVDLREQDMARRLHESEERIQALHDELSRRPEVHDADVEALKEQLREELRADACGFILSCSGSAVASTRTAGGRRR